METIRGCEYGACLAAERVREIHIRLNRLEGHIRGIRRMLEEGRDCRSLLLQLSAVRAALDGTAARLLEGYVEGCLEGRAAGRGEVQEPLRDALTLMLRSF